MDYRWERGLILCFTLMLVFAEHDIMCQEELGAAVESAGEIMALCEDYESAFVLEKLAELSERPVLINSGDEDEIARLFFLTEFQVRVLADHTRRNGSVVSIYELALLPAFDRSLVMLMEPYINLSPAPVNGQYHAGKTTITLTAATRTADRDEDNAGTRTLLRLRHEGTALSYGLTAENDPGEPFTFRGAWGADFLSGNVMYNRSGLLRRVIIGDYSLRFGEGLVFNAGNWQGAWLSAPSFMTGRMAVAPYTSTEENRFLRGAACLFGSMTAGAVVFGSVNMTDARIILDNDSNAVAVSNLVNGGVHVGNSSLEARNSLTESIAGMHLTISGEKVRGGITSSATWFSLPFRPDMSKPWNLNSFTGSRLVNLSFDIKAGTGPLLFFAEAACSYPGSWAAIGGWRAKPSGRLTLNMMARHFSAGYHAFHFGAFRAGSGSSGETGMAASLHLEAARYLFVSAGADHYRIPGSRYRSSSSSYGNRIEVKGEYLPNDNLAFRLIYTFFSREYDLPVNTGVSDSQVSGRRGISMMFSFDPSDRVRLATRASACSTSPSGETGYMLCQDLSFTPRALPVTVWLRYALCTSDGYDSRLYAWENDLHSCFSIPALYGECSRSYVMVSWKPSDRVELRGKYVITTTGPDFSRSAKQEFRIQGRIVF